MAAQIITVEEGLAHLEDGRSIDLLAIQATLNAAFQEHGGMEFAEAVNELAKVTQKWQGPHGEFLDGTYEDQGETETSGGADSASAVVGDPAAEEGSGAIEVRKVLVLSTAHLTKDTCLGYKAWPFIAEYEEGCYFYVGSAPENYAEAPADLRLVLAFAKLHGCVEVKFDRDADQVSNLPVYDW